MNILMMAPHPFFQERGTPIAVDLLLQGLSKQQHQIDLLTFNEGEDRHYPGVTVHRVGTKPAINGIKPGFSAKKLYLDFWLFIRAWKLLRQRSYDVIHAVEETGFMAVWFKWWFKVPFVLDMDSLLTTQLVNKFAHLRWFEPLLRRIEAVPIRNALAVVPVCQAIADEVCKYRQQGVYLLKDVSLAADAGDESDEKVADHFHNPGEVFMYIGNLESYQGIDLLLSSFELLAQNNHTACLAIIGGSDADIAKYQNVIVEKQLSQRVKLLGRKPVAAIAHFMSQADILVSPRTQGENTPMKIYSYLDSGRSVLATDLPTHTQVMNHDIALLAPPNAQAFAAAMLSALGEPELRQRLAANARRFIANEHSLSAFNRRLESIYQYVKEQCCD